MRNHPALNVCEVCEMPRGMKAGLLPVPGFFPSSLEIIATEEWKETVKNFGANSSHLDQEIIEGKFAQGCKVKDFGKGRKHSVDKNTTPMREPCLKIKIIKCDQCEMSFTTPLRENVSLLTFCFW